MKLACLLVAALLLGACATTPKAPGGKKPSYYSDDGPPAVLPDNLEQVPDAQPRDEPFHRYANRPYTVFGQTYTPVVNRDAFKQRGLASWYGKKFQGQPTASGEPYDMFAMTAAHKTLPIPSYAKVTNLANGKSVVVRINDRGPFYSNRIIDLSYAAAARIGIAAKGSGMVEVERVFKDRSGASEPAPAAAALPTPAPASVETPLVSQEGAAIWLQLGAFSSEEAAESFRDKVAQELTWTHEPIEVSRGDGLARVRLGPYRTREEAGAIADKVRRSLGYAPAITHR
jgi:peptidoglycan lytic transglycosylase